MASDNDSSVQILLKAWETHQSLARSSGDAAWKLRTWAITVWSGLVAFAYTSKSVQIVVVAMFVLAVAGIIELAWRQIQYSYIARSIEIEASLNDALVGELPRRPAMGVSTNIATPNLQDLKKLLTMARWLIWFPYLVLEALSLVLLYLES